MKTYLKLVLPVLAVVASACGDVQRNAVQNNAVQQKATATCSISLAPNSSADAIQRTVQAVTDGSLDACSGALTHRELYSAELASIDESPDGYLVLVFWMRLVHPGEPVPQRP